MAVTGKGKFPLSSTLFSQQPYPLYKTVTFSDNDDTEKVIFTDWMFEAAAGGTVYTLTAQGGSYSVTGGTAIVSKNKLLVASGGAYIQTGGGATLLRSKLLVALGGAYTVTGTAATITWTSLATVYTLTALGGSYSLSGSNSTILKSKSLIASGGSYSLTGASATLLKSKRLVASGGSYSLVGSSATITWAAVGGIVWPPEYQVLAGISYGPTGVEYTGTMDVYGIKFDITTGQLVKPINDKVVMTL